MLGLVSAQSHSAEPRCRSRTVHVTPLPKSSAASWALSEMSLVLFTILHDCVKAGGPNLLLQLTRAVPRSAFNQVI